VFMGIMSDLLIGELARRAAVSAPTIRYYEEIGLLLPSSRSAAGYRRYSRAALEELRFIGKAQALGFSLSEVREVLELSRSGQTPCARVLSLARQHLDTLDARIHQLQRFRDRLASELTKWDGRRTPTCRGLCEVIASAAEGDWVEEVRPRLGPHQRGRRRPRDTRV
jgi:DNA-binding transcriptional MerR regulator